MSQAAGVLLHGWIERQLDPARAGWLDAQLAAVGRDANDAALDIALGLVPRKLGKAALELRDDDLAEARSVVPGWDPRGWNVTDAARVMLLVGGTGGAKSFAERFRRLCESADVAELVGLYRGLPLYPEPASLEAQVGEGLRSNMRVVFEAIAHRNPYPRTNFAQHRWNHMVLKALFIGSPLEPIQGLDERANAELARIMLDFAHERWAAGRAVPFEIWRCVGPFAEGGALDDLARVLERGEPVEKRAAALALSTSPDRRAAELLNHVPGLARDIASRRLSWATLQ
ncbi:MAG TPA: EboA domain-containing protein [Burkholderiales bacterium]|nr:EboA domain-containing protein [Burkholderiales bacterium]